MHLLAKILAALAATALLAACDNNRSADNPTPEQPGQSEPPPPPTRGSLIVSPPERLASYTPDQLLAAVQAGSAAGKLLEFIVDPACTVDVHYLRYNTVDPVDAPTTASGALMVPNGADPACQGGRPILLYAHGAVIERSFNIANITDPASAEGLLVALAFAARGYIVVAPNYAGFDASTLDYHPYLHAAQQANDAVDALIAARSALPTRFAPTVTDVGKLFLTGYSQGGFVAMATHRLLQERGDPVTASAPMSGPYALGAFGDAVFYGQVIGSAPLLVSWLLTSYQRAYGNVYATPADAFDARYAPGIEELLPAAGSRSDIYDQGLLPREQLFSSTPPAPAYAPYTPAASPPDLAHVFARGFGPEALILNSYRLAYLQDAELRPDGGFPNVTDGRPAEAPQNGLRAAFVANDLRNWAPNAPVLMCGGVDDPTVLYLNTDLMQQYWSANAAPGPVEVLDVDGDPALDDPYFEIKAGFATAKEAVELSAVANGATDGGAAAVAEAYHTALVAPFCLAATVSFFNKY